MEDTITEEQVKKLRNQTVGKITFISIEMLKIKLEVDEYIDRSCKSKNK